MAHQSNQREHQCLVSCVLVSPHPGVIRNFPLKLLRPWRCFESFHETSVLSHQSHNLNWSLKCGSVWVWKLDLTEMTFASETDCSCTQAATASASGPFNQWWGKPQYDIWTVSLDTSSKEEQEKLWTRIIPTTAVSKCKYVLKCHFFIWNISIQMQCNESLHWEIFNSMHWLKDKGKCYIRIEKADCMKLFLQSNYWPKNHFHQRILLNCFTKTILWFNCGFAKSYSTIKLYQIEFWHFCKNKTIKDGWVAPRLLKVLGPIKLN